MEEAKELLSRYREGTCTKEELELLHQWFGETDFAELEQLDEGDVLAFQTAFKKQFYQSQRRSWRNKVRRGLAAAVVAAILLVGGIYFVLLSSYAPDNVGYWDVGPGEYKAVLTLADGRQIVLNEEETGTALRDNGMLAVQQESGFLVYEAVSPALVDGDLYNIIQTPPGGTFRVRLPDGTVVWLNSETTLRYPIRFETQQRLVELVEGEAYFQVKPLPLPDGHTPFIVNTQGEEVEVLGTEFNISAYRGERKLTTLISGSIQIGHVGVVEKTLIRPGQQVYFENGITRITQVDPESVYAWKDGYFIFDNESLEDVMKKVARWYNVTVDFHPGVDKKGKFWGSVSKFENVSVLLEKLELTGAVKFEINGRQVSVKQ